MLLNEYAPLMLLHLKLATPNGLYFQNMKDLFNNNTIVEKSLLYLAENDLIISEKIGEDYAKAPPTQLTEWGKNYMSAYNFFNDFMESVNKYNKPTPITLDPREGLPDILITYQKAKSKTKPEERRITIKQLLGDKDRFDKVELHSIAAFCHLRKMARTFVISKITTITNAETGETYTDFTEFLNTTGQKLEPVD